MNKTVSITSLPSATGFGPSDSIVGINNGQASLFPYELIGAGTTGATGAQGPTGLTGATGANGATGATGGISLSYKVYSALLTQTGTSAPVATVLENTLGVTPTWNYDSQGNYYIETTSNVFFENKTVLVPGVVNFYALNSSGYLGNKVFITTIDLLPPGGFPGPSDNLLNNTFIEIRVYN